jgi:protein-tyrosine phosphatase
MSLHASRVIQPEGAANVPDFGGLTTSEAGMRRRGRVFRSDVLYRLTESDTTALRALDIRTVIDLRSRDEVTATPKARTASGP